MTSDAAAPLPRAIAQAVRKYAAQSFWTYSAADPTPSLADAKAMGWRVSANGRPQATPTGPSVARAVDPNDDDAALTRSELYYQLETQGKPRPRRDIAPGDQG